MMQSRSMLHLFKPGTHAYGTLSIVGVKDAKTGKLDKKQFTKIAPLTDKLVDQHLRDAEKTVGFIPFVDDEHVYSGATDVDQYGVEIGPKLAKQLAGTPFFVARSPSGACHVWRISDEPVTAETMRAHLHDFVEEHLSGQDDFDCIFPKGDRIDIANGQPGNFINAPLAGILGADKERRLDRCIFDDNGEPITDLDLALDFVESKIAPLPKSKSNGAANPVEKKKAGRTLGVSDLRDIGGGNRSNTILSIGSSMIAKGQDYTTVVEPMITALFNDTREPGDDLRTDADGLPVELAGILKNLERKADKQPTDGFAKLVALVPETKTQKDHIRYCFEYDGTPIVVDSFRLLRNHNHIIERVFDETNKLETMTRGTWTNKLTDLIEKSRDPTTGKLREVPDEDTRSSSILWSLNGAILRSFNRFHVYKPTEKRRLLTGSGAQAWLEVSTRRVYFVPDPMVATVNGDKTLAVNTDKPEILEIVRAKGGDRAKKTLAPGVSMRVYWIPCPDDLFAKIADPEFEGLDHEVIETQKRVRPPKVELSEKTQLALLGEPKEPEQPY